VARNRRRALDEIVQIGVRLEEQLRRRLERVAAQRGHSMNAEIVERLQRSFLGDEDKISLLARAIIDAYPDVADRIEEINGEEEAAKLAELEHQADVYGEYYKGGRE
jgi:metal-responsive CopG/Arc/MetJ family transcriptional regulator